MQKQTIPQVLRALLVTPLLHSPAFATEPPPADSAAFSAKPNRCIALHRGQYCYQKVDLSWQVSGADDYCLYRQEDSEPLACWKADQLTRFEYRFKSLHDETLFIYNETRQKRMAETTIVVAWVYRSSKKVSAGWRLF